MKRPGKRIKASKESDVDDIIIRLSTRDRVLEALKVSGPLSMNKISILAGVRPRTVREHLAECMGRNLIEKSECQQCGSHMTYTIK